VKSKGGRKREREGKKGKGDTSPPHVTIKKEKEKKNTGGASRSLGDQRNGLRTVGEGRDCAKASLGENKNH